MKFYPTGCTRSLSWKSMSHFPSSSHVTTPQNFEKQFSSC